MTTKYQQQLSDRHKCRRFYPFTHSADNYQENVAFILSERAYKFKTGRCDFILKKSTEFIHFLATEKLDEVTLKIS